MEMVTVVAIIVIMTIVVLANFPEFRDRSSLELVAQEVALVVRQAQSFGTNTKVASFPTLEFPSYGLYFNVNAPPGAVFQSNNSFRLFADDPGQTGSTGRYSDGEVTCAPGTTECREVYRLPSGITFTKLETCPSSGVCTNITATNALNVVFARPNPEAEFISESGADLCSGSCSYAKITLSSVRAGTTQCVYIWTTGHIYTKPSCP